MKLKFKLDKQYLLLKMIANRNNSDELNEWKNNVVSSLFSQKIVEEIEKNQDNIEEFFVSESFEQFISQDDYTLKVKKILKDHLFLQYYVESLEYLNSIKDYWKSIESEINRWLDDTLRISQTKKSISVYISHPKLNTGRCVNQKYIFWGHWRGIKDLDYNITYLCHEYLHTLLPNSKYTPPAIKMYSNKDEDVSNQEHWDYLNSIIDNYYQIYDFEFNIIHSVIELISDNELYTILSQKPKYKKGHSLLAKYKRIILPYWFEYLNLSTLDIEKRVKVSASKNKVILKEDYKKDINKFLSFLINNPQIKNKFNVPAIIIKKQ